MFLVKFHVAVGPSEKESSFDPKIMFTVWITQNRNTFPKNTPKSRTIILGCPFFNNFPLKKYLRIIYPKGLEWESDY